MTLSKTRKNFADYFWFNRLMLEYCGVLPNPDKSVLIDYFLSTLIILSCGFLLCPGIYMILIRGKNFTFVDKVNIIILSLEVFVGGLKVIALLPQRKSMLLMSQQITRLWEKVKTEEDLENIEHYALRSIYLTYFHTGNMAVAIVSFLARPALMHFEYDANGTMIASKDLPYTAGLKHENEFVYYCWWAAQWPIAFIALFPNIAIDASTGFFVFQACAHLQLLQAKMRNVTAMRESSRKQAENIKADCREMIVECIITHQEIISYSEEVNRIFRSIVLLQMLLSIGVICGYGFYFIVQDNGLVAFACHLAAVCFQLWIFCWPPDNLQNESVHIGFEAFNIKWYSCEKEDKNLIEFIITRSQKPLIISAGKFAEMSLATFSSVLSSAFSYFTILKRVM